MDRETVTGRLARVDSHLANGERLIAEQQERVVSASRKRNGEHAEAESDLRQLEQAQIRYRITRARLAAGPITK